MREICTSGSTRGQQVAIQSPAVLLYWLILPSFFEIFGVSGGLIKWPRMDTDSHGSVK
jgi:hypothetical protein